MSLEILNIPLDRIITDFKPQITEEYLKRMQKTYDEWLEYDLLLAVEFIDDNKDNYRLVGGFDRYYYLRNCTKSSTAPCLIEQTSSESNRYLKILRRLFNNGDSTKPNRLTLLRKLELTAIGLTIIIKKTGFTRSQIINDYQYNEDIPMQYRTVESSIATLNWIASLKIPPFNNEIIEFLYQRANDINSSKKLSLDSIHLLKKLFLSRPSFFNLSISDQKKILNRAINFKGIILQLLFQEIDELSLLTTV